MVGVVSDRTGTATGGDVNDGGNLDTWRCGGKVDGDEGR